jgi:hypothetical protein
LNRDLDLFRTLFEQDLTVEPERVSDPEPDPEEQPASRRLLVHDARTYAVEVLGERFEMHHLESGALVASGQVEGGEPALEQLSVDDLDLGAALVRLLDELLEQPTDREPTPVLTPERVMVPPPRLVLQRDAELFVHSQQLLSRGHLQLKLYREIAAEVRTGDLTGALADVGLLRRELATALEQLDDLDSQLGARVHRECLTCSAEQAPGSLQCSACQESQAAADRVTKGALTVLRSSDPRWTAWRSK